MFVFMGQSFIPYLLEEARLVISDRGGIHFVAVQVHQRNGNE